MSATYAPSSYASTGSSSTKFSPANYLQGLGWVSGQSLQPTNPNARSKPVLVAHKKNLKGLGKERDTSYAWWDNVFENLAGKVKTAHDKTVTGLISPLPPRPKADEPPVPSTSSHRQGLIHDAIGQAKVEIARRQLYSGFLRGKLIDSTVNDRVETNDGVGAGMDPKGKGKAKPNGKIKKEKRKASSDDDDESKVRDVARKKIKKEKKKKRKSDQELGVESAVQLTEEEREALEIAKLVGAAEEEDVNEAADSAALPGESNKVQKKKDIKSRKNKEEKKSRKDDKGKRP